MSGHLKGTGDYESTQITSRKRPRPSDFEDKNIPTKTEGSFKTKVGIEQLPTELLLHIFKYLPKDCLFDTSRVNKYWNNLSLDISLWRRQRVLKLRAIVPCTEDVQTLLRHAKKLKHLYIHGRNDIGKLLNIKPSENPKLRKLIVEHSIVNRSFQRNLSFLVDNCRSLRVVIIKSTKMHGLPFYRTLAQNYSKMDFVKVKCTSKAEMNFFVKSLKTVAPHMHTWEESKAILGHVDTIEFYWSPTYGLYFSKISHVPLQLCNF